MSFTSATTINTKWNIILYDLIANDDAIKYNISNLPTQEHYDNLVSIVNQIMIPCCDYFGYKIKISSGYISEELSNYLVGVNNNVDSLHMTGQALDFDIASNGRGNTNEELFKYVSNNLIYDQLIRCYGTEQEPLWNHISYYSNSEDNRVQLFKLLPNNNFPIIFKY